MKTRTPTAGTLVAAVVALALMAPAVRAEVSVELDESGAFRRTVVRSNQSAKNVRIWSVTRNLEPRLVLNADGDLFGDLWPAIVEVPHHGGRPHVIWSRFDGIDRELAWSRWTDEGGWSPPRWIAVERAAGDDLDPAADYDLRDGRPIVVWWRDDGDRGTVLLSLFLSSRWMAPYAVSPVGEDARYPTVDVLDDGSIRVSYETPEGPRVHLVRFHRPDTITDDLNPLEYLTSSPQPGSIGENKNGSR